MTKLSSRVEKLEGVAAASDEKPVRVALIGEGDPLPAWAVDIPGVVSIVELVGWEPSGGEHDG